MRPFYKPSSFFLDFFFFGGGYLITSRKNFIYLTLKKEKEKKKHKIYHTNNLIPHIRNTKIQCDFTKYEDSMYLNKLS